MQYYKEGRPYSVVNIQNGIGQLSTGCYYRPCLQAYVQHVRIRYFESIRRNIRVHFYGKILFLSRALLTH